MTDHEMIGNLSVQGPSFRIRAAEGRSLFWIKDGAISWADDLTLDDLRLVAATIGIPLPEDPSTHNIDGIKFAISARVHIQGASE